MIASVGGASAATSRAMLDSVKEALGRRVLVRDSVRSNARGEPISARVDDLRIFLTDRGLVDVDAWQLVPIHA